MNIETYFAQTVIRSVRLKKTLSRFIHVTHLSCKIGGDTLCILDILCTLFYIHDSEKLTYIKILFYINNNVLS